MIDYVLIVGLFLCSFVVSTLLIRFGIPHLQSDGTQKEASVAASAPGPLGSKSTGFWIGFCETLLVFVLVYQVEYGALAIIIGAKEFVRREKIQEQPSYYLLGTLVNLSVAVLFALLAKALTEA